MHPSTFINDLWNGNTESEVFVAMSFHDSYKSRFENIYKPAIENIVLGGNQLKAVRVDERKSGDSIITEIIKGISQAEIVIADISSMGIAEDGYNVQRNGNVMYELGLAHASKSPASVIILKDDHEKMLFDVSSIPHFTIDFSDNNSAKKQITEIIVDRIKEAETILDIKLIRLSKLMGPHELMALKKLAQCPPDKIMDFSFEVSKIRIVSNPDREGLAGLLPAGVIQSHIVEGSDFPLYSLTNRGRKFCKKLGIELDK
jgi:hypothetical protein